MEYRELLAGCGSSRIKKVRTAAGDTWQNLTTLDFNSDHNPDVVWDLEEIPFPFEDNSFDEIHLYDVLEHTGAQGDWRFFFKQFEDFHRLLKPNGLLCATVPMWNAYWALGEPSHRRVIHLGTLTFLSQAAYQRNAETKGPMSDFRQWYHADFTVDTSGEYHDVLWFILKAIK
jgi:SAM-dependent methyltransferase